MTASAITRDIVIVIGARAATARELARLEFHVLTGVRRDRDADAIRTEKHQANDPRHHGRGPDTALSARVHSDPQGRTVRASVNNAAMAINAPVEAFPMRRQKFIASMIALKRGFVLSLSKAGSTLA